MFGNKKNIFLKEEEVIKILIQWKSGIERHDIRHFTEIIYKPDFEQLPYTSYLIKQNVLRADLEFNQMDKPGDFDVIIIPCSGNNILYNKSCAIEVKIVRPTRKKPSKNSNSLGFTQLKGLIKDGFPMVGLIHVGMSEPLLDHEKSIIRLSNKVLNMDDPKANEGVLEDTSLIKMDHFGSYSANKQMRRLLSLDIPKFVGINSFFLDFYDSGEIVIGSCDQEFWKYKIGYFNPYMKKETILNLQKYVEKNLPEFIVISNRSLKISDN